MNGCTPSSTIANCKVVDQANNRCAVCEDGYAPVQGGCVKQDPNCAIYDPVNGICQECKLNFKK